MELGRRNIWKSLNLPKREEVDTHKAGDSPIYCLLSGKTIQLKVGARRTRGGGGGIPQ